MRDEELLISLAPLRPVPYCFIAYRNGAQETTYSTNNLLAVTQAIHDIIDDPRQALIYSQLYPRSRNGLVETEGSVDNELDQKIDVQALTEKIFRNSSQCEVEDFPNTTFWEGIIRDWSYTKAIQA